MRLELPLDVPSPSVNDFGASVAVGTVNGVLTPDAAYAASAVLGRSTVATAVVITGLPSLPSWTIEGWVYNAYPYGASRLFGSAVASTTTSAGLYVGMASAYVLDGSGTVAGRVSADLKGKDAYVNRWFHVSFDSSNAVYLDGVRVVSPSGVSKSPIVGGALWIGGTSGSGFLGRIADLTLTDAVTRTAVTFDPPKMLRTGAPRNPGEMERLTAEVRARGEHPAVVDLAPLRARNAELIASVDAVRSQTDSLRATLASMAAPGVPPLGADGRRCAPLGATAKKSCSSCDPSKDRLAIAGGVLAGIAVRAFM